MKSALILVRAATISEPEPMILCASTRSGASLRVL